MHNKFGFILSFIYSFQLQGTKGEGLHGSTWPLSKIHMPLVQIMKIIMYGNMLGTSHCARFTAYSKKNWLAPTRHMPQIPHRHFTEHNHLDPTCSKGCNYIFHLACFCLFLVSPLKVQWTHFLGLTRTSKWNENHHGIESCLVEPIVPIQKFWLTQIPQRHLIGHVYPHRFHNTWLDQPFFSAREISTKR
jgi:hypothetical protein